MKKTILLLATFCMITIGYAQNTFPSFGNVGVGTTTPASSLDVIGDGTNRDVISIRNNNFARFALYSASERRGAIPFVMGFRSRGTVENPRNVQANDVIFGVFGNAYSDGSYQPSSQAGIEMVADSGFSSFSYPTYIAFSTTSLFNTTRQERMRLTQDGNLGIGTVETDTFRLAVNGAIRANEVVVETGWADFVFEDNYELKSLGQVEAFINENGHLPGMPAAEEVQANGIGLAEADVLLLQKVEELTLYTIGQEKEIEALKKQNADLMEMSKELAALKAALNSLQK